MYAHSLQIPYRCPSAPRSILGRLNALKGPSGLRRVDRPPQSFKKQKRKVNRKTVFIMDEDESSQVDKSDILARINIAIENYRIVNPNEVKELLIILRKQLYPSEKCDEPQSYGSQSVYQKYKQLQEKLNFFLDNPVRAQLGYCDIKEHKQLMIEKVDSDFFKKQDLSDSLKFKLEKFQAFIKTSNYKQLFGPNELLVFDKLRTFMISLVNHDKEARFCSENTLVEQFKKLCARPNRLSRKQTRNQLRSAKYIQGKNVQEDF